MANNARRGGMMEIMNEEGWRRACRGGRISEVRARPTRHARLHPDEVIIDDITTRRALGAIIPNASVIILINPGSREPKNAFPGE